MTNIDNPLLAPPYKLKQCRHGLFLFNENDFYMGKALDLYGEYGEGEIQIFQQIIRPGYTVLDIGANIGTHTVFLSKYVGPRGRVYAFEPQRIVNQQLVANIALNSLMNVQTYQFALGTEKGFIHVPPVDYMHVGNFGAVSMSVDAVGEKVELIRLDDLDLSACHVIKIDVEGMEQQVLSGSLNTISKYRPIIYAENDRKQKSADLIRFIADLNYDMYWHLPRLYNPQNFFNNAENIYSNTISINMLCLPKEMNAVVEMRKVTGPDDDWQIMPG